MQATSSYVDSSASSLINGNASLREGNLPATQKHAIYTHTALKETLFRRQRPEELPVSFELGVHIQGRRKNRRSEARKLPPGARPATAAAVSVSAPSLDGDCASASLIN